MSLVLESLKQKETDWDPKEVNVVLKICTEACIVPSDEHSARLTFSHVVVLDNFITASLHQQLFESVTEKGWNEKSDPPASKWTRQTCDQAGLPPTWGLNNAELQRLLNSPSEALLEVQSRLCKLYPEVDICYMPSEHIQSNSSTEAYDCDKFVANAAVYGDAFQWHVDADPWTFDETSNWCKQYGTYFNGEPKKPLFVSMILYLNKEWEREWDAETLFLDSSTETGFFIRPKMGRVVLMAQDILHRLSIPSQRAQRPRYSLVWKLIFIPKDQQQKIELARPEWGPITHFGSAAKVKAVQDALL